MTDLALNGNLSWRGLRLSDPDMAFEDFEALCEEIGARYAMVRNADVALRFAIGDAILAGEELYGERSYQAFEKFGLSHEVLKESARIAAAFPYSIRRQALSWSHHRAIAARPTLDERREWLLKAQEMSHHELRAALKDRAGEVITPAAPPARYCDCCGKAL